MKSFSNEIPDASKFVSTEQLNQLIERQVIVLRRVRNWIFGLALANAILTIALFVKLH